MRRAHKQLLYDFEHWYERAEETRVIAEGFLDISTREQMLNVSCEYRRLAEQAIRLCADKYTLGKLGGTVE